MQPGPLLSVRDLDVTFPAARGGRADGAVPAVRGLSYDVEPGEVLGIVGESGSGKSVSSLAVMGLLPDRARVSGSIRFDGREMLGLGDRELSEVRGRRVAMVFQDPLSALTPVYTVGAQVAEAVRRHQDVGRADADRRAVELLDLVGIPQAAARASSFPHEFSGGMRQRVVIALAIANDPALIIADEPTTALDVTVQAQVLDVLATAREITGAALVLITHDLGVVAGQADRVMVMYAGRAVETGGADALFASPRMPYTRGLLGSVPRIDGLGARRLLPIEGTPPSPADLPPGCPFGPRCSWHAPGCDDAEPALLEVEPGHAAACVRLGEIDMTATATGVPAVEDAPRTAGTHGDPVLVLDDLVRHYAPRRRLLQRAGAAVQAVDGVSLELHAGETLGLVGESGCGKTTTLHEILELTAPQSGRIEVLGQDTAALEAAERRALRRDLQVVFQDPMASLDPRLPMRDLVAEPLELDGWPRPEVDARVAELVDLVGLSVEQLDRYPAQFSGGQRQRIGIARALALRPRILVLDEPVSALDVSIQAGVLNLLDELRSELGLAYLFVAHDLSVIRYVADRVAVMYLGRIVEVGEASTVFAAPAHPYTRALLSAVPVPDPPVERSRERIVLTGDLPSPADPPSGCRFRTRCPLKTTLGDSDQARCVDDDPALHVLTPGHAVACHHAGPTLRPRADPTACLSSPERTR